MKMETEKNRRDGIGEELYIVRTQIYMDRFFTLEWNSFSPLFIHDVPILKR
jgi:hypothetical protein